MRLTASYSWPELTARFAKVKRQKAELREYQRFGVRWLLDNPYSALFVDMGLGKTVMVLTLLVHLLRRFAFNRCLIIAPIKVANQTWPTEIREWQHVACLPFAVLTGDAEQRRAAMRKRAAIHIINREAVPWLVAEWGDAWPYDVVIFDESSRLRDHKSQIFKAMKSVRHKLRRFHQLTATPASQTYMHLFAQLWLLDRGQRLGNFITHYRKAYFDHDQYRQTYTLKDGAKETITARISDLCLVMERKDYLDMPDAVIVERPVTLTKAEMVQYRHFEREMVLQVSDEQFIEAQTRGILAQKLLQLASGAVYDAERVTHFIHAHKLNALADIEQEAAGQTLLVAYWFKSSLERLRKLFPKAVLLDRAGSQVDAWNRGEIAMLLVHPQSAAHGLNLQHGGHNIVCFDAWHSLELFQQLIKRLDRPGQQNVVTVQMLTATGTVDETVAAKLRVLEDAQDDFFARLKALRRAAQRESAA
jgi:hypothetical protein